MRTARDAQAGAERMENGAADDHFGPSASGGKINRHPGRDVHKPVSKCLHDVLKIEEHKRETHRMPLKHTVTHMRRTEQTPLP